MVKIIIVDSREKKWEHIRSYFDKNGIEYSVKKLDVGDYQLNNNPRIIVDRKQNLAEISHNLFNAKDRARFMREVRKAKENGMRLFIVCEHGGKIRCIKDIAKWHDKYTGVPGKALMGAIYRVSVSYGVEFIFCSKRSTARTILKILTENTASGG